MSIKRILIVGAAGRDFHVFNLCYRGRDDVHVVAFTAAQIPDIAGRMYPPELAGEGYPEGIPIEPEDELERLINDLRVDEVVFAYSDVTHEHVMHLASRVIAAGADYKLHGLRRTWLRSEKPVVSVCAVRTGVGKSQTSRHVLEILRGMGHRVAVVRHPMPYGDLAEQAVQRFASYDDLEAADCTIEEREEYEPHLDRGAVVFAGVDYARILEAAEAEADVVLWDGGNNDLPFFAPDLHIVLADPHRTGHERRYHPGEANARAADVLVINKVDTASGDDVLALRESLRGLNPTAPIVEAASPISVDDPDSIAGRRVVVVEDGPTLTHGEMSFGAGWLAARRFGAAEIVDPRPWAVGGIADTFRRYPKTGPVLPAMGYGQRMVRELEATLNEADAEVVVIGTPIDLGRLLDLNKPSVRVRYELQPIGRPTLEELIEARLGVGQAAGTGA